MNKNEVLGLIKQEMAPAIGVTEPSTIALASARAAQELKGDIKRIELTLDPGIYKNAHSCTIPNTDQKGIAKAALLGAVSGDPAAGLKVLQYVSSSDIKKAEDLFEKDIVDIDIKNGYKDIYVCVKIYTEKDSALTVIQDRHDNIALVEKNDEVILDNREQNNNKQDKQNTFLDINIDEILSFIKDLHFRDIEFTLEAVGMNKKLAQSGKKGVGLALGSALTDLVAEEAIADDILNYAKRLTAFAIDARMGGVPKPAMSFCGSGDHGIIATLPLTAVTERKRIHKAKLAKAVILSYLITYYIKSKTGKLSAYCGCAVAAGTGAAAGITYLLDGSKEQIVGAINNMAGNITGIICDGGNFGCSLKAATAASAAVESALLAIKDHYLESNTGIVGNDLKETLDNMGKIATPGMEETNQVILDILKNRSE